MSKFHSEFKSLFRLLLVGIIFIPANSQAQGKKEIKNIFTQAESYFIYEEYELANPLYVLIENTDNMNLKYKIGTCYLNIPGEKEKSIPYLEQAVKSANLDSKSDSYKEMNAPVDAYFFLAKAYMVNGEFENAINTLQTFLKLAKESKSPEKLSNFNYIDQLLNACRNAIQFRQVPVNFTKEPLWNDSDLGAVNENPAVSFDGKTMVFTERRGIENAIFFSKKINGKWELPVEITQEINGGTDCSSCALNNDGTELFVYKNDNYDGALYSSNYIDGKWTPIKILNKNINTKFYESHASISSDGKRLYFTSNRDGGFGNLDIYVSERDQAGEWGPAVNLGKEINTPFNEDTPFITGNDSLLYFSSEGHNTMGGYDIFKSGRSNSAWESPSNLGFPVNSADDDKFFQPLDNGNYAYYSLTTAYKKKGIFLCNMSVKTAERVFRFEGRVTFKDSINLNNSSALIEVNNKVSGETILKDSADLETGNYNFSLPPGIFTISYSSKGYYTQSLDTVLTPADTLSLRSINIMLLRDTTTVAENVTSKKETINLSVIPEVTSIDSSILVKNLNVKDESAKDSPDTQILYYTVQVIALHKPVDVSYFKYINDMIVLYNDVDRFYRYTTGKFENKEAAYRHRSYLIKRGYPKQIFVKKVTR